MVNCFLRPSTDTTAAKHVGKQITLVEHPGSKGWGTIALNLLPARRRRTASLSQLGGKPAELD